MFKRFTPGRCLLLLILTSCFIFFALVPRYQLIVPGGQISGVAVREVSVGGLETSSSTPLPSASTPVTPNTPSAQSSAPGPSLSPSLPANPGTTTTPTSSPTTTPPSTPPPISSPPTTTAPPLDTTSQVESTNSDGQVFTQIITVPALSSSASPSPSASADSGGGGSSRLSTASIIGMSVCGGIALIGIIAFIVWKVTRKRASDRFDDAEAIKWPELNSENHGATAGGFSSEVNLNRGGSIPGYEASIGSASQSQVDLYAADPYAVPPLPHLNPNQPPQYRDDPNAGAYYDPYPGPPQTNFHDAPGSPGLRGEAIPMTQIPPGSRARSPGPQLAFAGGRASPAPSMGRQSPGPYAALSRSPAPPVGYGSAPVAGRQSPGPHDAYGYGR